MRWHWAGGPDAWTEPKSANNPHRVLPVADGADGPAERPPLRRPPPPCQLLEQGAGAEARDEEGEREEGGMGGEGGPAQGDGEGEGEAGEEE